MPVNEKLAALSASDTLLGYRQGHFQPSDVIDSVLERIESVDPKINAFIRVEAESARQQAHAISDLSLPLAGVPIAIKDIIDVAGLPTTCHSRVRLAHRADKDALVVQRLKEAGAIIVGKVATHEFALGGPAFDLPFPPARNPWNTNHHPGGSSSGSAAAVAARMVPLAIGTDTAGSIRHPAGACGIFGIKPTFGAVPCDGVFPLAYSMDHVGPLSHCAQDLRLALEVISGSACQPTTAIADPLKPLQGLRIGYVEHFHTTDLQASDDVADGLQQSVAMLSALGADVRCVQLPKLQDFLGVNRVVMYAEAWAVHAAIMKDRPEDYGQACRRSFLAGAFVQNEEYLRAQRYRRVLVEHVNAAFASVDLLLTANMMDTACRIDDAAELRRTIARQARGIFNLTGHPAISIPVGVAPDGLPLAIQMAAPWHQEASLLHEIGRASCRERV